MLFEAGRIKQPRGKPKRRQVEFRLINKGTGKIHTYGTLESLAWGVVSQRRQHPGSELVLEKVYSRVERPEWGPIPRLLQVELDREIAEVADETI